MRHVAITVLAGFTILATLIGCSTSTPHSENGEVTDNGSTSDSPKWNQLVYTATGTQGDGADDATTIIEPPVGSGEARTEEDSILPLSQIGEMFGRPMKVDMTVKSLSSDGTVGCEVTWRNVRLKNTASGDHAVARCVGVMKLK